MKKVRSCNTCIPPEVIDTAVLIVDELFARLLEVSTGLQPNRIPTHMLIR
ncbi:MAG: hypothetical protein M1454_04350 [Candidatus Thermoplasmatota archaeon]|nr:hypothetical protein [Candidatus Thermoplasmatota archaeon]MCL5730609.1 hypothetical protein [Candidatus Thermoplasmatota archaeon]